MKKLLEIPYLAEIIVALFIVVLTDSLIITVVLGVIAAVVCDSIREKLGINTWEEGETK